MALEIKEPNPSTFEVILDQNPALYVHGVIILGVGIEVCHPKLGALEGCLDWALSGARVAFS